MRTVEISAPRALRGEHVLVADDHGIEVEAEVMDHPRYIWTEGWSYHVRFTDGSGRQDVSDDRIASVRDFRAELAHWRSITSGVVRGLSR